MTGDRIDARDVLDANARTARSFRARICGRFRRAGPNAWDDYRFEAVTDGAIVQVLPGVSVQVETSGAQFRMRWHGEVVRLEWQPEAEDGGTPVADADRHRRFVAHCVRPFANAPGIGAAAGIAKALCSTGRKPPPD